MSPMIKVDARTYKRLETLAVGFDTPAKVIERLLNSYEVGNHHNGDDTPSPSSPPQPPFPRRQPSGRITLEMVERACVLGRDYYAGEKTLEDAAMELTELGMNTNSSKMYINNIRVMCEGRTVKRAMKAPDFRIFVDYIRENFDEDTFRRAVEAYTKHVVASWSPTGDAHDELLEELQADLIELDNENSVPNILREVEVTTRQNSRGEWIKCTRLNFGEDVPKRTMDEWADPTGEKTAYAKSLIGKRVVTRTWRSKIYSPLEWWTDIEEASEEGDGNE